MTFNSFSILALKIAMLGFFLISDNLNAKVLILTHAYNRPEFIPLQHDTFKKFLKDDYEFIVFNDAPTSRLFYQIHLTCLRLGVKSITVPQKIHSLPYLPRLDGRGGPSAECADTIQYMLDTLGFDHSGIVVIIDSDMFLIREFCVEDFLSQYEIACHPQYRNGNHGIVTYLLPNLMFFNMEQLPEKRSFNVNLATVDGVMLDTGGFTHYYLTANPDLKWFKTDCVTRPFDEYSSHLDPRIIQYFKSNPRLHSLMVEMKYDYEFYVDYAFLHFRAGSNWYQMDASKMNDKTRLLLEAMNEITEK